MDAFNLPVFKSQLRDKIVLGQIPEVFNTLTSTLQSEKKNVALVLHNQYNALKMMELQTRIAFDQLQVQQSGLTVNLLSLIDMLEPEDFQKREDLSGPFKNRTGSVLYSIPGVMGIQHEEQCVVRLAYDERYLTDDIFASEDTHIRTLRRIDDRMEVEIVDPSEQGVFSIRTISSTLQKVERDDYTEWLFFVKPLAQGKFPLYLKVSIVMLEAGEKVRKELVLQEVIEVVTQLPDNELHLGKTFRQSGLLFTIGLPAAAPADDQQKPGPQQPAPNILRRIVSYAGLAVVATALGWYAYTNTAKPQPLNSLSPDGEQPATAPLSGIVEPVKHINIAPQTYLIDADRDTVLLMPSGTSIEVSAGTFETYDKQPVTTPVEIRFREFSRPADVILSGIPMEANPGHGKEDAFESAGMFEIDGFSEGKPVRIVNGKSILVNLESGVEGDFDFWKYDPQTKAWVNQAPAGSVRVQPSKQDPANRRLLSKVDVSKLTRPANMESDPRTPFNFKGLPIDVNACRDLRSKKTEIILLYAGSGEQALPEAAVLHQINTYRWRKSSLKPTADPNLYTLTMEGDTTLKIPVTLALSGKEYKTREEAYESLLAETRRENANQTILSSVGDQQNEVYRSMFIKGFGLYNHDRFYNRPDVMQISCSFNFGMDLPEPVKSQILVYLITGNDRAIVQYQSADWEHLRFSPSDRNIFVAVLPDGRIATYSQEAFRKASEAIKKSQTRDFVFDMQLGSKAISSADELQSIIKQIAI